MNNMNKKLLVMIEGAITAGIGVALGFVPNNFGPGNAFDLSFGLIFLGVFAIRRGLAPGLVAAFVWALLKIVMGGATFILSPEQWIFDYVLAFTAAGFMGAFSSRTLASIKSKDPLRLITWVSASAALGIFARWLFHFIGGVLVWAGEYAPEGQAYAVYSLVYNGPSFFANFIMVVCVLTLLARLAPMVFLYGLPKERAAKGAA
jgi:thiamine transporter